MERTHHHPLRYSFQHQVPKDHQLHGSLFFYCGKQRHAGRGWSPRTPTRLTAKLGRDPRSACWIEPCCCCSDSSQGLFAQHREALQKFRLLCQPSGSTPASTQKSTPQPWHWSFHEGLTFGSHWQLFLESVHIYSPDLLGDYKWHSKTNPAASTRRSASS